jgi:hypothetical protein
MPHTTYHTTHNTYHIPHNTTHRERIVCEVNWLIERLQYIVETLHSTEDPGFQYTQAAYINPTGTCTSTQHLNPVHLNPTCI